MFANSYDIIWKLFDDTQNIVIAMMWIVWPLFELSLAVIIIAWLFRNILNSFKYLK